MDRHRVAIIVPALNEAATVGRVAASASSFGAVIVVDDGSADATPSIAEAAGATVVRHLRTRGYDDALNSGFSLASKMGAMYAVTLDADGQHDPHLIPAFLGQLDAGSTVVMGVRPRPGRVAERVFGWYTTRRYGIHDPLCGLKAYDMRAYEERGYFDTTGSMGTELAIYCASKGYGISEVPIPIERRLDRPRIGSMLRANSAVLRALVRTVVAGLPMARSARR